MEWISVNDDVPKYGEMVLVFGSQLCVEGISERYGIGYLAYGDDGGDELKWYMSLTGSKSDYYPTSPDEITHWMPLPTPPKG